MRARALNDARAECDRLGISVETDAATALLSALGRATGAVEFYASAVSELPMHPVIERDDDGRIVRSEDGVYGPTYHASGRRTGEAKPHVLVQLFHESLDRQASIAAATLRAGVDERRIRLQEADARVLYSAVVSALGQAGLTPAVAQRVQSAIAENLRAAREYHPELVSGPTGPSTGD